MNRNKYKISIYTLGLCLLMAFKSGTKDSSFSTPVIADTNVCSIQNRAFQDGEEITYKLYYNWNFVWLAAGEVVFRVKEQNDKYHISVVGKTYPSYEWFFKVRDTYETYLDKETLLPITSIRDVQEGKYRLYDKVQFDQQKGKAKSLRGSTKEDAVLKEYDIDNCMHDIVSIIYFSRNVNFDSFQSGEEFPIKIFMDKESWPLKVKYKGKEERKRIKGKGKFNTLKFTPEVIAGGMFKEKTIVSIWVSNDENRVPLLIEAPLSVGSVKAVIKNYKGLKYDMTAKIK